MPAAVPSPPGMVVVEEPVLLEARLQDADDRVRRLSADRDMYRDEVRSLGSEIGLHGIWPQRPALAVQQALAFNAYPSGVVATDERGVPGVVVRR